MAASLRTFLKSSVTRRTEKTYEGHWRLWCKFIAEELGETCPLLKEWPESQKSIAVALFLQSRHQGGSRGKQATAVTAGVRLHFTAALLSTAFLESPMISAARAACSLTAKELREKKDGPPATTTKVPICEDLLSDLRRKMWEGRGWEREDIDFRMTYVGCMWGYEMDARVGEYTSHEVDAEDHCVRCRDLIFSVVDGSENFQVLGGGAFFQEVRFGKCLASSVAGFQVQTSSQKTGAPAKAKVIGRRSPEEAQFLDDLVTFVAFSGVKPMDELFCRYLTRKNSDRCDRKTLTGRMVRDAVKGICMDAGLPPDYFSSHSLRKAATTQMRAMGVSEADMLDRGGYMAGSQVMRQVYDYYSGAQGPLASNSNAGGSGPTTQDVRSWLPPHTEE